MNYLNGNDKKVSLFFHLKCIQVSFFPSYSSLLTLFRHGFMNLYILVDIKMFQYVVFQTWYVDNPHPPSSSFNAQFMKDALYFDECP